MMYIYLIQLYTLLIQISDFCLFAAQPPYEQTVYIQDNNVYMQDNYVYMHT